MGFLGCLRSGNSSILRNVGPRFIMGTKHQSFCSTAEDKIFLEDIMQEGTLEEKKSCLKGLLQAMACRMSYGIAGGCMDPKKIPILDGIPYLEDVGYVVGKDPDYLSSVENLVDNLHRNDHLSPQDIIKYNDFKIYTRLLSNKRHLVLLSGHPHLHTKVDEMRYIIAAREQMKYIPAIPNAAYPKRHFPRPKVNQHQVPITTSTSLNNRLYSWHAVYKMVRGSRLVNISDTIKDASPGYHHVYNYRSSFKPLGYIDYNPIDEMDYYINVIKHIHEYGETVDLLFEMFPYNTTEMFKFHWCYDGHAMGTIDLEEILALDRP